MPYVGLNLLRDQASTYPLTKFCLHDDFAARQMEFWRELTSTAPSLSMLDAVGTDYERSVESAEHAFLTVLKLEPNSVAAMRGYAQFLIEVRKWRTYHYFRVVLCMNAAAALLLLMSALCVGSVVHLHTR